jgi:hypothetical protein
MNKSIVAIVTSLLVLTPLAAQAGPLQNRLNNQQQRIYQGVKNGSISPKEYRRLERRQDKIEAARRRDVRDGGKLTRGEKHRLNHRLNGLSNSIYRTKHN